jgi:hypothetical protein
MGEARADRALEPALSGNAAEWIARIRALQGEGRLAEATRELARFRETFADADARLPSDLRAWSESLPR